MFCPEQPSTEGGKAEGRSHFLKGWILIEKAKAKTVRRSFNDEVYKFCYSTA